MSDTPTAETIAAHLRTLDTAEDGHAYLDTHNLDRDGLLAVAAVLQLTAASLPRNASLAEIKRRIVKQAITARRKYEGLRNW
uniref:hypothetical protein n=1 Tax=Actinokineospora sp. CA-119265 TaxID=3239890 RepID=UPI003F492BA2